jgi:hypothetical protein
MRVSNWSPGPITEEIEKRAMDRLETAAGYVMAYARSIVPIGKDKYKHGELYSRAGALKRTIRVVRQKGDPNQNIRVYAGKKNIIDYAAAIEYGTSIKRNIQAQPYLRPALQAMRGRIMNIMENG